MPPKPKSDKKKPPPSVRRRQRAKGKKATAEGKSYTGLVRSMNNLSGLKAFTNAFTPIPRHFKTAKINIAGVEGTKITGCCPIGTFYKASNETDNDPIVPYSTAVRVSAMHVHPFVLFQSGTPEYAQCSYYTRYLVKKLKLIVQSAYPATTKGLLSWAYYPDGSIASSAEVTQANIVVMDSHVFAPIWLPVVELDVTRDLSTKDWFYIDADASSVDAGKRQSFQGAICGIWQFVPDATAVTYGFLNVEYEIDLVGVRPFLNLALGGKALGHLSQVDEKKGVKPSLVREQPDARLSGHEAKEPPLGGHHVHDVIRVAQADEDSDDIIEVLPRNIRKKPLRLPQELGGEVQRK